MIIYQAVEIQNRELYARSLAACFASNYGFCSIVSEQNVLTSALKTGRMPVGIFHDKSAAPTPERQKTFSRLKGLNFSITSIDEESGLLDNSYESFAKERFSDGINEMVDALFFWGSFDFKGFSAVHPKFRDISHLTGNPRVDLWRPEFSGALAKVGPRAPDFGRPFVLVSSNASGLVDVRDFCTRHKMNRQLDINQFHDQRFWSFEQEHHNIEVLRSLILQVEFLASRFPEVDFVIRPHPTESVSKWLEIVRPSDNIFVIKSGSITDWIKSAVLILHNGCTCALESAAMGKHVAVLNNFKSKLIREIPNCVSVQHEDLESISEYLHLIVCGGLSENITNQKVIKVLDNRFINLRGKLACESICKVWQEIKVSRERKDQVINFLPIKLRSWSRNLKNSIVEFTDLEASISDRKFQRIDKKEFSARVNKMCASVSIPVPELKFISKFAVMFLPRN